MSSGIPQVFPLEKILVATDGSVNAGRAVDTATKIAKRVSAELIVLSVAMELVPPVYSPIGVDVPSVDYSSYLARAEADAKRVAEDAAKESQQESIKTRVVVLRSVTSVAEAILEEASKEKVNLIVVGTRGLGGFKKLLMGSVSSAVVDHAHCAVLVVR
jgi:nucleotide-binding universal stress UspA family protein